MSRLEDKTTMPASPAIDEKTRWRLGLIETFEARRLGSLQRARAKIADDIGVSPGSLERVRRGRVKSVKGFIIDAVRAAFIGAIAREIAGLEHELEMARLGGLSLEETGAVEALAALEAARRFVRGERDAQIHGGGETGARAQT